LSSKGEVGTREWGVLGDHGEEDVGEKGEEGDLGDLGDDMAKRQRKI